MVSSFVNRCIWAATSSGLGDFVVNAPSQNGFTPAQCASPAVVDGGYYHYFAVNGAENEEGDGQYTAGTTTLSRLTIRTSSNSGSKVNFSAAPTVFMGGPTSLDMPTVIATTSNVALYVASYGSDSNTGTSVGTAATNGTTSTSSPTLHFASVPSFVAANQMVWDSTTNLYVGEVLSTGVGTVTLVANAANAVGSGDTLVFANPLLTLQRAVNVAAGYNYQGLYYPTVQLAAGTYGSTQVLLPTLLNCPSQAIINGDTTTWANVIVNDGGTGYTFTAAPDSHEWTVRGMSLRGTYGAFDASHQNSAITIDKIDFSGNFTQFTINPDGGNINAYGGTFTLSTAGATSGYGFLFARGQAGFDESSITVSNSTTYSWGFIGGDFTGAFFAFDGTTITNGSNIHVGSANCLTLTNGAYWESDSNCKVDGTILTRANFPGSTGSNFDVDVWSVFAPDKFTPYGYLGNTAGVIALFDITGALKADFNHTQPGDWNFENNIGIQQAGSPQLYFINTNDLTDIIAIGYDGSLPNTSHIGIQGYISGNHAFDFDVADGSFKTLQNGVFGWAPSTTNAYNTSFDTGISRLAAGSIAVGNGTAGDKTGNIQGAYVLTVPTTVGALPAASSALKGARAFVTDELAAVAFNTVATGGGANNVPVFCDGTTWRIG